MARSSPIRHRSLFEDFARRPSDSNSRRAPILWSVEDQWNVVNLSYWLKFTRFLNERRLNFRPDSIELRATRHIFSIFFSHSNHLISPLCLLWQGKSPPGQGMSFTLPSLGCKKSKVLLRRLLEMEALSSPPAVVQLLLQDAQKTIRRWRALEPWIVLERSNNLVLRNRPGQSPGH